MDLEEELNSEFGIGERRKLVQRFNDQLSIPKISQLNSTGLRLG